MTWPPISPALIPHGKKRHKDVPQASGSVPGQCRSKTVSSRKVEQKDRMGAAASQRKTPQAKAHCGVSAEI
jgi:hypothetical protein